MVSHIPTKHHFSSFPFLSPPLLFCLETNERTRTVFSPSNPATKNTTAAAAAVTYTREEREKGIHKKTEAAKKSLFLLFLLPFPHFFAGRIFRILFTKKKPDGGSIDFEGNVGIFFYYFLFVSSVCACYLVR